MATMILQKLKRKTLRALFHYDPSYTDMFTDPSEGYFARLYLYQMRPYLEELPSGARVLDAGCQAGRFVIPLAKNGFQVTGIDTSGLSLGRAKKHCRENRVSAELIQGEIGQACHRLPESSFDAVLCSEVLYLYPHFETLMKSLIRVLKPEGILMTSHRTKFYYLVKALLQKELETALLIAQKREGRLWGTYFNWQTVAELRDLHHRIRLQTLGIRPIGIFSEMIGIPGTLEPALQEKLFEIEKDPFDEVTGCARYLLAIGKKISNPNLDLP